ncbi:glycoside hydrolase family 31 protein [Leptothermofonsia sichuanensis E412]|uniref:glycoside hydrolase family 31 protein n=1 Tax=Leptothermofonsia sichuanensis TaxID=2917832 RepID=UPI001CA747CC|nr:glycoside hydrolase family 31 protein [Leptothermofonsia sichuanensis]QZZ22926.1 glycoside hydrolase family 31 protein [Leptothermofonsia sichuanensis E412]
MPQYFGKLPKIAQAWTTLEAVQSFEITERGICCYCSGSKLLITAVAPDLIRVRLAPGGDLLPRRSWAVNRDDAAWDEVAFEVEEGRAEIALKTQQLTVQITLDPCRIACFDRQGQRFAQDTDSGMGWSASGISTWKQIEPNEHFYGFGERTGLLDKRAEIKTNWTVDALDYTSLTDEMYQAIPFFMSLRPGLSYGVFLNSTFWSQFDLGATRSDIWQMHTRGPELDYYIIYGPQPAQVLRTYTALTGRMSLPPKWSLGYHQCRWSYESEAIVKGLAQEFRQRQIPCDAIHLDIDYMQGYRVFTWNRKRFPDPKALISNLSANGFHTVVIVDPGVKYEPEADYPIFDQGLEHDYFVRKADGELFHGYVWPEKAVFPDFLRADVREWWSKHHTTLTEAGVAGIWNDMNEPALDDRPFGENGNKIWFPMDAPQGPPGEQTIHAEVHNLYGLNMVQASCEALKQLRPEERSFVLTRSGFAGVQRWSAVWMGDNQSLWEHLEMSLPMLCNMGLSGVPFVGCDIGGFAGNATPEMFARWMQVGMLYPFMRSHSALHTDQHEPWAFGDRVESICREYIELRYRLLPYLYSLFWEATMTGAPILRPLLYHYPDDPYTYALHDQVFLGPFLMAAPIYRPGVEYRAVYLPAGTWYDWWSHEQFEGPTHILAHAPLERMPLYLKAGAIMPMQPVMQYVNQQPVTELTLKIAPGEGEWTFYEDDGHSFDYQTGAWAATTYRVYQEGKTVSVEVVRREGQWTPPERSITVVLVQGSEQPLNLVTKL